MGCESWSNWTIHIICGSQSVKYINNKEGNMYDDILGKPDKLREIKNRKFDAKKESKPKQSENQLDLFEDLVLEMEDIEEIE
jgi:hypothetical protein